MPSELPADVMQKLGKVWVRNRPLKLQLDQGGVTKLHDRPRRGKGPGRGFSDKPRGKSSDSKRYAAKAPRGKKPSQDGNAPLRKVG